MNGTVKVPAGLKKCQQCGYYNGEMEDDDGLIEISCACHNQLCDRCGEKVSKFRVPSSHFDEKEGLRHTSIVSAWGHRCPDGVQGQLRHSYLIDPRTGENLFDQNIDPKQGGKKENLYVVSLGNLIPGRKLKRGPEE